MHLFIILLVVIAFIVAVAWRLGLLEGLIEEVEDEAAKVEGKPPAATHTADAADAAVAPTAAVDPAPTVTNQA